MGHRSEGAVVSAQQSGNWFRRAYRFGALWIAVIVCLAFALFTRMSSATVMWVSIAVLFSGLCYMCEVIRAGRAARAGGVAVTKHRRIVAVLTTFLLVGYVGVEMVVMREGGLWGPAFLDYFHLVLATGAFLSFVGAFIYNGVRRPDRHARYAYAFLGLYIVVFVTGTWLAELQFPFLTPMPHHVEGKKG